VSLSLVLLLGFSYLLTAFYSGSETALVSVDPLRLQSRLRRRGDAGARRVKALLDEPEKTLAVTLVGTNLANATCAAVATSIAVAWFGDAGPAVATGVVTLLVLVGAEILPKTLGVHRSLGLSILVAPLIRFSSWIFAPLVWLALAVTRLLQPSGEERGGRRLDLSREEVFGLMQDSHRGGVLGKDEVRMADQVLGFRRRTVGEIMIGMRRVTTLREGQTVEEARALVVETGYSRFPVLDRKGTRPVGMLVASDLLGRSPSRSFDSLLRPVLRLGPRESLENALVSMQRERAHLALVTEGGSIRGLVTLEDVLEEIVGDIRDEHDPVRSPTGGKAAKGESGGES
jgi:putative hemolysin